MKIIPLNPNGILSAKDVEFLGGRFNFLESFVMGGIGSPKLIYVNGIDEFTKVSALNNDLNFVNIEIFKKGGAIRYTKKSTTSCALVPFGQISSIDFETFIVKVKYRGREIVKHAADIYLNVDGKRIEFLLNPSSYRQGKKFFKKKIFESICRFTVSSKPPIVDNGGMIIEWLDLP